MRLKKIASGTYTLYAIASDRDDCPLLDFLKKLGPNLHENRSALIALFDQVAADPDGPRLLPKTKSHTIAPGIWQFTEGRLRVAWFYDKGKIIICTHGFLKKTQGTRDSDKKEALKSREAYLAAVDQKTIVIREEP